MASEALVEDARKRAVIYARISNDKEGREVGVDRQQAPTYGDTATGATVYTDESHGYVVGIGAGGTNAGYVVLENDSAPTSHEFAIGTDGDSLSLLEDGSALVSDSSGAGINLIAAPWARDANGVELPTHYTVEGNVLTQHIDTAGAVFPVVADPTSECGIGWCSIYFNRTETSAIAAGSAEGATAVAAGCAAVNIIIGGLCAAGFGLTAAVAKGINDAGNCLGYNFNPIYHGPFVEPRGTNHCP
ncbi:hypothetical protein [Microbacterium sp. A1-JK]|uniref:hypothetical protein n=1 Tax=Microbacterium sp. A1-JK TaxID=3177516 RepID=UPI003884E5E2